MGSSKCLQFLVIQRVLGMGSLSWHGPQIRPVIGWPFLQVLFLCCPLHILQVGQIVGQRFCGYFGICISLLIACREICVVIDTRSWERRFYVGNSLVSLCSMSCMGVFFSIRFLLSVCDSQSIVLATILGFTGFPMNPFSLQLNWLKPSSSFRSFAW